MRYDKLAENPLKSRRDVQQACLDLVYPLLPYTSEGHAYFDIGDTLSSCQSKSSHLESFSRPMWGLGPLLAGGGNFEHLHIFHEGLQNGTDPDHPEYWGDSLQFGQRQNWVEMAALGLFMAIAPGHIWEPLDIRTKDQVATWLNSIQQNDTENNWLFFNVLTNLGLKRVGSSYYNAKEMKRCLDKAERCYLGEGWYNDGPHETPSGKIKRSCDYYNPFAWHFYGLIYAAMAREDDPERCQRFTHRAVEFANQFMHWFSQEGAAIPYGRSLTYRFAQGSFWAALAFANIEAISMGIVKGMLMRHLRWWFRKPAFSYDGILQIGYSYPNIKMTERYNSPGSPYLAMKSFLILALPSQHPFWSAEEEPLALDHKFALQKYPMMLFPNPEICGHTYALCAGQSGDTFVDHHPEKYAKFAYSATFGFNVSNGDQDISLLALDNMLYLSEGDNYWRGRYESYDHVCKSEYISSKWRPWRDVEVETFLIPCDPWHIRVHHIVSGRSLKTLEGGFPLCASESFRQLPKKFEGTIISEGGFSGIADGCRSRAYSPHLLNPNSNLVHPRTVVPLLNGAINKGESWLITLVMANPDSVAGLRQWARRPELSSILKQAGNRSCTASILFWRSNG